MLRKLIVQDFAIIEDLTVDFQQGMTVLTGQTGAGKSLIIDTISLLLGARADADMIRYGKERAHVEGIFDITPAIQELLIKYEIPQQEVLTITREIYGNSKNTIRINNHNTNLTTLKNLSVVLADIHIQNDTYRLFNPDTYLELLDKKEDKKLDNLLAIYSKNLYGYLEAIKEFEHILKGQKGALEKLDFLRYEVEELSSLNLYPGIDQELEDKISKLTNYDKIFNSLTTAYTDFDIEPSPIDRIYNAAKSLEAIQGYDSVYQEYSEKLFDSYYIISEIKDELHNQISMMDYDEEELNQYVAQFTEIKKAKEKYKKNVEELIQYLKSITLEIEMATNYDSILEECKNNCKSKFNLLVQSSKALTEYRKKAARLLEEGIIKECIELDLESIKFEIIFEDIDYNDFKNKSIFDERGCDHIQFMVSFNKGEPLKQLHKVASGGEMSRIMLAFKSYMAKNSLVSLMVFDEIDTGVSGATAKKIAYKMHQIAKHLQVLCITHLPQVAAIGDHHKHIYKQEEQDRTLTQIKDLSIQERVEEIALMLSGDKLSIHALEHAKALLGN